MAGRILLHSCCGPCTFYPSKLLRIDGWEVRGFFYNPNIHPYQEWQRRLDAYRHVARMLDLPIIVREDYDLKNFLRQVVFRESQRCRICYVTRLEAAARLAKKSRFDAFTTTLLFSKHQKHDLIRQIAEEVAKRYGIPFLYLDFRKGWKEGQEAARKSGVYRQVYCGCIYSEEERFRPSRRNRETAPSPKTTGNDKR